MKDPGHTGFAGLNSWCPQTISVCRSFWNEAQVLYRAQVLVGSIRSRLLTFLTVHGGQSVCLSSLRRLELTFSTGCAADCGPTLDWAGFGL